MLKLIVISLFYSELRLESNQRLIKPSVTEVCSSYRSHKSRLVPEQDGFTTTSYTQMYNNKTPTPTNLMLLQLTEAIFVNSVLGEKTDGLESATNNASSRTEGKEFNLTAVADESETNSRMDDEWSEFNLTAVADESETNVEWSEFNETFEEKAREDGYRVSKAEESPYSVLLVCRDGRSEGLCTGSLLTDEWVLTAAHCVDMGKGKVDSVTIYAGVNSLEETKGGHDLPAGAQKSVASEFHAHPRYKSGGEKHDVAVVRAKTRFTLTPTVNTLNLSTEPWSAVGYRTCRIVGFGKVNYAKKSADDYKRKTNVLSVKKPCKCNFRLKQMYGMRYPTESYICAKPVEDYGICSGDSGGGLVCDGVIRATAMMIVKMYDTQDCEVDVGDRLECASDRGLTVFLGTCQYLRWISTHAGVPPVHLVSPRCVEVSGVGGADHLSLLCLACSSLLLHLRRTW